MGCCLTAAIPNSTPSLSEIYFTVYVCDGLRPTGGNQRDISCDWAGALLEFAIAAVNPNAASLQRTDLRRNFGSAFPAFLPTGNGANMLSVGDLLSFTTHG
jgi:hypothetical protein